MRGSMTHACSMKMLRIRPTDINTVFSVIKKSWFEYYSPTVPFGAKKRYGEIRRVLLSPHNQGFLSYEGNKPVAVMIIKESPRHTELDYLFIAPGFTSCGIGSALMNFLKSKTQKHIEVQVVTRNIRGKRFYERHGGTIFRRTFGRVPAVWYKISSRRTS